MVSYFRVGMGSGLLWSGPIVSCHSRYENYENTRLAARRLRRRAGPPSYFSFLTITKGKRNSAQSCPITFLT